jgi:ferric-dicitrate binding protein FerR (iron transport regulator)
MWGTLAVRTAKLSLLLAVALPVCLQAQLPLPFDSAQYAAKAVAVTGQVSVFKDSQPWALSSGDSIQPRQLIQTGPDGQVTLQVSDGSTIQVYPNSQFVFRANPGNWRDLIDMVLGRIRVHIEHFGNLANPNTIRTPAAVISVRGTILEVSVDESGDVTQVDVEEGVVEVEHALLPRDHPATVRSGETLRVYKNEPIARNLLDKGTIWRQILRALSDAATFMSTRTTAKINLPGGGPMGTPGGGNSPGDSCKTGQPGCTGTAPPVGGPGTLPPVGGPGTLPPP